MPGRLLHFSLLPMFHLLNKAAGTGRVRYRSFGRLSPVDQRIGSFAVRRSYKSGSPMKLSRTVAYAVRATLQLPQLEAQGPVPCSQLASEGKMPERFLLQILRNLVTHGILRIPPAAWTAGTHWFALPIKSRCWK